jgi:hypothetical protein
VRTGATSAGFRRDTVTGDDGRARDEYESLYGASNEDEYADTVLGSVEAMLPSTGWVELERALFAKADSRSPLTPPGRALLDGRVRPRHPPIRLADGKSDLMSPCLTSWPTKAFTPVTTARKSSL